MMVTFAVHFQRAGGTQYRRPLDVVNWSANIGHCRQQKKVFHVKNARGLVRTFDQLPEATEVPPFSVRHRSVSEPFEEMARQFNLTKKLVWGLSHAIARSPV